MAGQIFTVNQSFSIIWEGRPLVVEQGATAREGHPLMVEYPQFFTELVPQFEYTPKPPAPAPAKKAVAPPVVKAAVPSPSVKKD